MRYSKRKLKGLPTPKEIIIKSLADYIKLFSSRKFDAYILRGEPTNFHNTVSSALRGGKEYPFIQMKNEFKRDVIHKLTSDERNDFLAFAQHHGIPTNLIDFTRSPLIALYFACQPFASTDKSFDTNRGFVYLLEDDLIDITSILSKGEDENILTRFVRNTNNILLDLYKCFNEYDKKRAKKFYFYFKQLADDMKYYFDDIYPKNNKKSKFPMFNEGEYKTKIAIEEYFYENNMLYKQIYDKYGDVEEHVLVYILMLQNFLKNILDCGETVWQLNCIPNFIYTPMLSFERGRNQKGLFIYQAYLSFNEEVYDAHIVSQQRVWPDIIFVIENKQIILEELDVMGINEKYVYGDFDNIAKCIKRKYSKTINSNMLGRF